MPMTENLVDKRPAGHDLDYRTNFERRVRLAGKPVYRAEFRKAGEALPDRAE